MLLFFVLFFGIAFLLNMLLRATWIMAFVYPIIVILIIDKFAFGKYFTDTSWAFSTLGDRILNVGFIDIIVLSTGFAGTILSGVVIKMLRKSGYQMF